MRGSSFPHHRWCAPTGKPLGFLRAAGPACVPRDRETDRETERHRDTETQRQRDTETQRQREAQRQRDTETQRHRDRERHRDTETQRRRNRVTEKHPQIHPQTQTYTNTHGHTQSWLCESLGGARNNEKQKRHASGGKRKRNDISQRRNATNRLDTTTHTGSWHGNNILHLQIGLRIKRIGEGVTNKRGGIPQHVHDLFCRRSHPSFSSLCLPQQINQAIGGVLAHHLPSVVVAVVAVVAACSRLA